jgi:integrase
MALTNTQIKNLKPGPKTFKKSDGQGLFIEVRKTGNKIFRFKYMFDGKHQLLTLGRYPDISLKEARQKHLEARRQLAEGINPAQAKKAGRENNRNTFGIVAREWYENTRNKWTSGHAQLVWRRLEANVLPWLENRPITEITTGDVLKVLRKIEARGAVESAHRICQVISRIFVYAVASGYLENNPASEIHKALKTPKNRNLPAITDPKRIRELLQATDGFSGSFTVYCALRFAPLVFVRPGELRKAEWIEIDWKENLWIIAEHRMKKRRAHTVPLSKQARNILEEIYPLTGNSSKYIFPSIRTFSRPMSENTLRAALLRIGFSKEEHCPHGFRTTASTRLHEMGWKSRVVEMQLAHVDQNKVRGIYNRAEYLDERIRMMQAWADYLDTLKNG